MGISGSHIVADPAMELFVYAGLMFAVMAVFIVLAIRYKYVDPSIFEHHDFQTEKPAVGLMPGNLVEGVESGEKKQRVD